MGYRIKTVAEMTGVPRQTLLSWERRYGLPRPTRADNGYRLYSEEDVAMIARVQQLREQGHAVSEAMGLLALPEEGIHATPSTDALPELSDALVDALVSFDRGEAERIDQRASMLPFEARLDEVYLPALRELGERWHDGTASIGQEHFGTFFLRERLIGILRALGGGPASGPVVVCAGIPGEYHEFGLLASAIKLALRGWRVLYLGSDVPPGDVAQIAADRSARLVCQSVMGARAPEQVVAYAQDLSIRLPSGCLLALGGPGVAGSTTPDTSRVLLCTTFEELTAGIGPAGR